MAPYNPPNTHYAHLNVRAYPVCVTERFMKKFYGLTARLKVRYIWYNYEAGIIEIWGPYESFRDNHPVDVLQEELKNVYEEYVRASKNEPVTSETNGTCQ